MLKKRYVIILSMTIYILGVSFGGAVAQSPGSMISVDWSPDGTKIAGVGYGGAIRIWDVTGKTLLSIGTLTSDVYVLAWSPDSARLATGGADRTIRIWNALNGQLIYTLPIQDEVITALSWSPDGMKIATAAFGVGNALSVWDGSNYQQLAVTQVGGVFELSWSPNSSRLAVAQDNDYVIIFTSDLSSRNPIQAGGAILSVDWSEDGSKVVIAKLDGQIAIWNTSTLGQISTFLGHSGGIDVVRYSPNGQFLASAGKNDGLIKLWDANTLQTISTFQRPQIVATSIAWSPDGTRLAFGSTEGTVRIEQVFQGGRGLRGAYYALNNLTGIRFFRLNSQINFNWAASSPEPNIRSQAAVIPVDNFSIRWTGFIEPLYSEAYTFFVNRNDGARLWVNGQQIINAWTNTTNAVETASTAITLTAGVRVPITLEYYEATGNAQVSLSWQSARQAKQVVPTSALYPPEDSGSIPEVSP
jgi:WD40 repeat protein